MQFTGLEGWVEWNQSWSPQEIFCVADKFLYYGLVFSTNVASLIYWAVIKVTSHGLAKIQWYVFYQSSTSSHWHVEQVPSSASGQTMAFVYLVGKARSTLMFSWNNCLNLRFLQALNRQFLLLFTLQCLHRWALAALNKKGFSVTLCREKKLNGIEVLYSSRILYSSS